MGFFTQVVEKKGWIWRGGANSREPQTINPLSYITGTFLLWPSRKLGVVLKIFLDVCSKKLKGAFNEFFCFLLRFWTLLGVGLLAGSFGGVLLAAARRIHIKKQRDNSRSRSERQSPRIKHCFNLPCAGASTSKPLLPFVDGLRADVESKRIGMGTIH